jgi:hypothetical protein
VVTCILDQEASYSVLLCNNLGMSSPSLLTTKLFMNCLIK